MKCLFIMLLLVASAVAQPVTATLPQRTVNTTFTPAQTALLASIRPNETCSTGVAAHIYCAPTSFSDLFNFASNCAPAGPLTTALADKAAGFDAVIIIPAGSVAVHNGVCQGPGNTVRLGGCDGNNKMYQDACTFLMPQTTDSAANYAAGIHMKIFLVTSHYTVLPSRGTRLFPRNGDGAVRRLGQVANVAPASDFAPSPDLFALSTASGGTTDQNATFTTGHGSNDYVPIGMEIINASRVPIGVHGQGQLGGNYSLMHVNGMGSTGARVIQVNYGGVNVLGDVSLTIDGGNPKIARCHVGSATGPDCGAAGVIPGTSLLYFDGLNTHWIQGRTTAKFMWNQQDFPASDFVVNPLTIGSGAGQCPAGAVAAGNAITGNMCVVDSTHAWTSITYTPTSPWNGGIHGVVIDTFPMTTAAPAVGAIDPQTCAAPDGTYPATPVPGGTWCALTEHAYEDGAIVGWFDSTATQQWTITSCTGCFQSSVDGAWNVPAGTTSAITIQGASTGTVPRTPWNVGTTQFEIVACSAAPTTMCVSGTPTVTSTATAQTITGLSLTAPAGGATGFESYNTSPLVQDSHIVVNTRGSPITPNTEIDPQFRTLRNMNLANAGIDLVGPCRQCTNWGIRGQGQTLDVWGIGPAINWTNISCAAGSTTPVNFGSNIAIDSCTPVSANHFKVTLFVCDGVTVHTGCTAQRPADEGASRNLISRSYIHGSYGLVLHTGNSYPGNTDTFPVPIEILGWSASGSTVTFTATPNSTITNGTTLQLWGFQGGGAFLNHKQITVAGLSCTTTCTFTGSVAGGSGSASAMNGTVASYSLTSNILTLNLSPAMPIAYALDQPFFVNGFPTSTFLNNQTLWVASATTSKITAYICRCAGVNSYSVTNNVATINFQAPMVQPFPPGSTVDITGPPPPLSTGTGTVVTSSPTQITANVSITANITGYSITNNVITFNVTAPLLATFIAGRIVVLSGFPTSTFLNGQSMAITAANTTSVPPTITAGFTHANVAATTETGLATMPNIPTTALALPGLVSISTIPTTTETGQISGIGAAGVPCVGSGGLNPTWNCFMVDYEFVYNGMHLEGSNAAIEDSYMEAFPSIPDSTGIVMAIADGPIKISNNFIGGASEHVFVGASNSNLFDSNENPNDVEVYGNDLYGPPALWVKGISLPPSDTGYASCTSPRPDGRISCSYTPKDKYEQKAGNRYHIYNNVMDNNYLGWFQTYATFVLTPRPYQGSTSNFVDDVIIENNQILNSNQWAELDSWDSNCQYKPSFNPAYFSCGQSAANNTETRRIAFKNNLHLYNQVSTTYLDTNTASRTGLGLAVYGHDWVFDHNTVYFQQGITPVYLTADLAAYYNNGPVVPTDGTDPSKHAYNVWFTNNVFGNGTAANGSPQSQFIYQYPNSKSPVDISITGRWKGNVWNHGTMTYGDTGLPTTNSMSTTPTFTKELSATCANNVTAGTTCLCTGTSCGPVGVLQANYTLVSPAGWLANGATPCNTTDCLPAGINEPVNAAAVASAVTGSQVAVATYTISGTITLSGAAMSGVSVQLTGTFSGQTFTDASGNFSFNEPNGNYTLTPVLAGYTFSPSSINVTVANANAPNQNFTASKITTTFYISGTVSGAVSTGVTISLSGAATATTTTDTSGNYIFNGLSNGSYTITPSLAGYIFTPSSITVSLVDTNFTSQNFSSHVLSTGSTLRVGHLGPGTVPPGRAAPLPKKKAQPKKVVPQ